MSAVQHCQERRIQTLTIADRHAMHARLQHEALWERREQAVDQQARKTSDIAGKVGQGADRRRRGGSSYVASAAAPFGTENNGGEDQVRATLVRAGASKGKGTFAPSSFRGATLAVKTAQTMQSSAGGSSIGRVERQANTRKKATDWGAIPPSAAADIYRSGEPLKHDHPGDQGFSPPVKPQHPIALAQAERSALGHSVELLTAYGSPLPSLRARGEHHGEHRGAAAQRLLTDDDLDALLDGEEAEAHRTFASSLRQGGSQGIFVDPGKRVDPSRMARTALFTEATFAVEDKREQSMAAVTRMAAARLDRNWDDGMSDLSGSVSEIEAIFRIDAGSGVAHDAAVAIAEATLYAAETERELVDSWRERGSSQGLPQHVAGAGAPAFIRQQTPARRAPPAMHTPATSEAPAAQVVQGTPDLAGMRAEIQRLAQAAEQTSADAERLRSSKSGRNAQAREKFLGSNWDFSDMASDAGSDGGRHVSVTQESLQWAGSEQKRALVEAQRGFAKDEITRRKQSWLQGAIRSHYLLGHLVCLYLLFLTCLG